MFSNKIVEQLAVLKTAIASTEQNYKKANN